MSSNKLILGLHLIYTLISLIVGGLDGFVYASQPTKQMKMLVHLLIADHWQHLLIR